jgi:membrane protein required for colicin V production
VTFSFIDFIFVGLIGLFMIRCYLKGFVSELLSMAGIVLGILAALFLHKNGGVFIKKHFMPEVDVIPEIAAFIILFIFVFLIVKLLERMLVNIIDEVSLTNADSYLGIIFGLAEGVAVVSFILFVLKIQPLFDASALLQDSFFAGFLLPLINGRENILNV